VVTLESSLVEAKAALTDAHAKEQQAQAELAAALQFSATLETQHKDLRAAHQALQEGCAETDEALWLASEAFAG
jgi:hypothetical protein